MVKKQREKLPKQWIHSSENRKKKKKQFRFHLTFQWTQKRDKSLNRQKQAEGHLPSEGKAQRWCWPFTWNDFSQVQSKEQSSFQSSPWSWWWKNSTQSNCSGASFKPAHHKHSQFSISIGFMGTNKPKFDLQLVKCCFGSLKFGVKTDDII